MSMHDEIYVLQIRSGKMHTQIDFANFGSIAEKLTLKIQYKADRFILSSLRGRNYASYDMVHGRLHYFAAMVVVFLVAL
jgi:hypothetical protein